MNELIISACVCCHNASQRIEETLISLICQIADYKSYEILLIDNASEDLEKLKVLINELNSKFSKKINLFEEMNIGLSYARNKGIEESKGEYIFFIDDDAVANPRLIESYIKCIENFSPDVIGGNVIPLFEVKCVPHLDSSYWNQWSLKYFGQEDRWLNNNEYFIGTNIGAKKELLLNNPFDENMGRKGHLLIGGEEWFLGDVKFQRRFVKDAYVLHKVGKDRMMPDYFAKRFVGYSKTLKRNISTFHVFIVFLRNIITQGRLFFVTLKFKYRILSIVKQIVKK